MPQGYNHMTQEERCQIYALKAIGISLRSISRQINRNISTVSRELSRNTGNRGYRYKQAHEKAFSRRSSASRTPIKMTSGLVKLIEAQLALNWSPEQIAGRLTVQNCPISYETIYKHIWADKKNGGTLYKNLRHRAKPYNKRSSINSGRGYIANRRDICERPLIVESKSRIGDWEGDTIIGAGHKGAIVSYVDRHSKFTLLHKIDRKTSANVIAATLKKMANLEHPVLTITYDNGKEFAGHQIIAEKLNAQCFFATPYRSWERGLNEHTNGLVRQYLPKSTMFSRVTDSMITVIENKLNHRPRKSLQYRTPFEVFYGDSTKPLGVALRT